MPAEKKQTAKGRSHSKGIPTGKSFGADKASARPKKTPSSSTTAKPKKGFSFKALPADAYRGKQDRLKENLIQKAKLKKKYAKVLKEEGYLGEEPTEAPALAKKMKNQETEEDEGEAMQAPWLQKTVVDDWSDEDEDPLDKTPAAAAIKKIRQDQRKAKAQQAAEREEATATESDQAEESAVVEKKTRMSTGKALKAVSEKRTGFQPYDASKRRTKFTSAEKEARSVRQQHADEAAQLEAKVRELTERKRQRALATKREHSMTKRGQPRMGDRIKNLLSKLQGQV
ncbi:hypothetical protein BCR37DRAFT_379695 [Protomyces lactucae-debilis]|uniref:rRNA-processing protein FYV7 n=1 Tax=Protomyces lactucae-debilis TaxID=2754530 RepID=A0A1Y2FIN7_PROLT|nr:uncharacterized protein BCR37DRAFT_379695 [Protomyces lactucae-debilis]ORY82675.1 hypothetical protein BCR37DRAFT_379695 [Protomyces lactucae-debilis]